MLLLAHANGSAKGDQSRTERRRGLRIRQTRPVKIFEPALGRYYGGQTEDFSSTGLRVELPISAPVRPGKLLNIHVGQSSQQLAPRRQMLPARIVWVERLPHQARARLLAGLELLGAAAAQIDAA